MREPKPIQVRPARGKPGRWTVECAACIDAGGVKALFEPPWIVTTNQSSALLMAEWHATRHQLYDCGECGRPRKLDRPEPVDTESVGHLFRWDGQLYALTPEGVRVVMTRGSHR